MADFYRSIKLKAYFKTKKVNIIKQKNLFTKPKNKKCVRFLACKHFHVATRKFNKCKIYNHRQISDGKMYYEND